MSFRSLAVLLLLVIACCGSPRPSPSAGPVVDEPIDRVYQIARQAIHVECRGSGAPAVVLDSGLGNDALVWDRVYVALAGHRVCRYDRPGLGQSVPLVTGRSAVTLVEQLREVLRQARVRPPYVLVGASFGGLLAQLHARTHPEDVAGVVLVDATHPALDARIEDILTPAQRNDRRSTLAANSEGITYRELLATDRVVAGAPSFPGVPLAVLRHGLPFDPSPGWPNQAIEDVWQELQDDLARLSPQSQEVVAEHSQHRIAQTEPELVIAAIEWVVDPHGRLAAPSNPPVIGAQPLDDVGPLPGAFTFGQDGNVWIVQGDGTGRHALVDAGDRLAQFGRLSPSGQQIAYVDLPSDTPLGQEPATALVTQNLDGSDRTVLVEEPGIGFPSWSPDGTTLAFSQHGQVWLVKASGGQPTKIADGGCPVWAPDGGHLAICTVQDEVNVISIDGREQRQITDSDGVDEPRAWSPDGSKLAVYSERDGDGETYVIDADGSVAKRVTDSPGFQVPQAWLPGAGILIASSAPDSEVTHWIIIDPDSGVPLGVPQLDGASDPVAWRPGT